MQRQAIFLPWQYMVSCWSGGKQPRSVSHIDGSDRTFFFGVLDSTDPLLGGNVWLKNWSEANGKNGANPRIGYYIGIYFALGVGSAALVVVQTLILWIFCSIEVSIPTDLRIMHYSGS
jgi:hypothetical protein